MKNKIGMACIFIEMAGVLALAIMLGIAAMTVMPQTYGEVADPAAMQAWNVRIDIGVVVVALVAVVAKLISRKGGNILVNKVSGWMFWLAVGVRIVWALCGMMM